MKYTADKIDVSKLLECAKSERIGLANKYNEKVKVGSLVGTEKLTQDLNKLEMLIKCLLKIGKSKNGSTIK